MSEYSQEIEKVVSMIPYLEQLTDEIVGFAVSTLDKYVLYSMRKGEKLPIRPGDPIKPKTIAQAVIDSGSRVVVNVPSSVAGVGTVGYKGIGVPIMENGRLVGVLSMGRAMYVEQKLRDLAQKMNSSVGSVSEGASGFAASAEQLAATSAELAGSTEKIREDVKDMDAIIRLIMEIASQTHLLGLNAAIEAARAGDMGRGFNVVAEEIRKLAARTQSSAKEVTAKLNRIKNNIDSFGEHVLQVSAVSQEQAATSQDISSSIQDLDPMAKDLLNVAAELVK